MSGSIAPLLPSDEYFNHQIVDTFASVGQSDPAWTEKICGMAAAKDGSLQIAFGFGKYTNRNVVDAYAGIAQGKAQWTVRGSRALHTDPDSINVGPMGYEIVEPLKKIRIFLEPNDAQPIAFDIVFEHVAACVVEDREDRRDMHGFRRATDQIRYHQSGTARGWLSINGERHVIDSNDWICTRDHSWGVRPMVGVPASDLEPDIHHLIPQVLAIWNPIVFTRADGSHYAFHHYYLAFAGGGFKQERIQGGFETLNGQDSKVIHLEPILNFESPTKRLKSGSFKLGLADGRSRTLEFESVGDLGFYLGAGHYHGGDGKYHGSWRGEFHLDGDYVADTSDLDTIKRYGQFRDCIIKVTDPEQGAIGYGNCQTHIHGAWPEFGLSGDEPML
jgi:hypothetical protein